jgi:hypothetical protein
MNMNNLSELNCQNEIHSKYILYFLCGRNYTRPDSVHTGSARRQHQHTDCIYRGADKSLARPGRKQATATEDFDVHITYLLS